MAMLQVHHIQSISEETFDARSNVFGGNAPLLAGTNH